VSDYQVFSTTQQFGPYGIGGAWCGAPTANTTDQGWVVIGGGAQWDNASNGAATTGEWPDPNNQTTNKDNPGWDIQANGVGGPATVYAVCIKTDS
jgi:hypothetical protein